MKTKNQSKANYMNHVKLLLGAFLLLNSLILLAQFPQQISDDPSLDGQKSDDELAYIQNTTATSTTPILIDDVPMKIELFNPQQINTIYEDYCLSTSADKSIVIFCSEIYNGNRHEIPKNVSPSFYITSFDKSLSRWDYPVNLESEQRLIISDNVFSNHKKTKEIFIWKEDKNNFDIFQMTFTSGNNIISWTEEIKLNSMINTKYNETGACMNADASTLYFVSDRPGGFGGKDIWASDKLSSGEWGKPYNLGSKVNTAEDEESPFLLGDNATLYFSSKGHNTLGGYDIFSCTLSDEGLWSNAENLGSPINSKNDDLFYLLSTDEKSAFYSTIKSEGIGKKDIYQILFE